MTEITVEKGIFIYQSKTKKAGETFEMALPEEENLVVLRDIIEGVLLDNLRVEEGVLDTLARVYLQRKGKEVDEHGTLKVEEGILRLVEQQEEEEH